MTSTSEPTVRPSAAAATAWLKGLAPSNNSSTAETIGSMKAIAPIMCPGNRSSRKPVPSRPTMEKTPTSAATPAAASGAAPLSVRIGTK